jgi:hypothetical protein
VSAANGTSGSGRALVVGPLAVPGFLVVLVGVRQHRRSFVLLGAVLVGLAVRLVDRPEQVADPAEPAESAEPAEPAEPEADQPETA